MLTISCWTKSYGRLISCFSSQIRQRRQRRRRRLWWWWSIAMIFTQLLLLCIGKSQSSANGRWRLSDDDDDDEPRHPVCGCFFNLALSHCLSFLLLLLLVSSSELFLIGIDDNYLPSQVTMNHHGVGHRQINININVTRWYRPNGKSVCTSDCVILNCRQVTMNHRAPVARCCCNINGVFNENARSRVAFAKSRHYKVYV